MFWIRLSRSARLAKESATSLPIIFLHEETKHKTVLLGEVESMWIIFAFFHYLSSRL